MLFLYVLISNNIIYYEKKTSRCVIDGITLPTLVHIGCGANRGVFSKPEGDNTPHYILSSLRMGGAVKSMFMPL
jgi:hypothetical protein